MTPYSLNFSTLYNPSINKMPRNIDIATRALVVTLKASSSKTTIEIATLAGLNPRTVDRIYERAIDAGFDSPNLNAIEPAWPYLKRNTTKKGAPKSRTEAIAMWQATWKNLPLEAIQRWIERILRYVQETRGWK